MFVHGIYFQECAKLEYGRMVWRDPEFRERLLRHWRDPRHPHAARFAEHRRTCATFWKVRTVRMPGWTPSCVRAV